MIDLSVLIFQVDIEILSGGSWPTDASLTGCAAVCAPAVVRLLGQLLDLLVVVAVARHVGMLSCGRRTNRNISQLRVAMA